LVLIASVFPLLTQVLLLFLPEKYDVNEEISKYFQMRKERKRELEKKKGDGGSLDSESLNTGSIRVKTNMRDEIGEEEYLIDRVVLEDRQEND